MEQVIKVKRSEIRRLLAEHYGVPLKDVLTRKYSFVVIREVCEQERYLISNNVTQIRNEYFKLGEGTK